MTDFAVAEIELPCGRIALIDRADLPLIEPFRLYSWVRPHTVYVVCRPRQGRSEKTGYLHKILTGNDRTDHRNRNGLDNRRENLRAATRAENNRNQRKRNPREFKGVYRSASGNWFVTLRCGEKQIYGGSFQEPAEAARVYDRLAVEHFGEFARLNFPAPHVG